MEDVFKFALAVILLPLVVACVVVFNEHLSVLSNFSEIMFRLGMISFLVSFLFVFQFMPFFDVSYKFIGTIFELISPVNKFIANITPAYFLFVSVFLFISNSFFRNAHYNDFLMFFAGLGLAMHILCSAKSLQGNENELWKPDYYLSMVAVLIFSSLISVLLLDLCLREFTFPDFCKDLFFAAKKFYILFAKKILLLKT